MKTVYEFRDYKRYLSAVLAGTRKRSGLRSKLALHLGCQTAHVSQVLNGHTHFSVEQAFKINAFLGHDREEAHFFVLMVNKDRAGTLELRDYYQQQLNEILHRRFIIKNRVSSTREVPYEHQGRYYSNWYYLAIHIALSIPELQSKEALAQYFHLPLNIVAESLEFLMSIGLAEFKSGRYVMGPCHVHLGHDSDNINKHHFNWRVQAMDSLARMNPDDLHYSVVFSLSCEDVGKLKDRIIEVIRANLKDVAPSKEEVVYCTCIDFFSLKK
ncbi:MAG: TIGR02147 family protein [Bdellovibrionales bacterium]